MGSDSRTTILHSVVLPSTEGAPLRIAFWGEVASADSTAPVQRRRTQGRVHRHPLSRSPEELTALLEALGSEAGEGVRFTVGSRVTLELRLPSVKGRVLGSWESLHADAEAPQLLPWEVTGSGLEFGPLVPFLRALPPEPETVEVRLAASTRYLMEVARFALSLLSRERFLPSMGVDGGNAMALWRAAITTDADMQRERELLQSFPMSLEAGFPEGDLAEPRTILGHLLNEGVDHLARSWLSEGTTLATARDFPEDRWIKALGASEPSFTAPEAGIREIGDTLGHWSSHAVPEPGSGTRTCFRLDPPREESSTKALSMYEVPDGKWWLRVFLQDRSDPSLLVPARMVYAAPDGVVEHRGHSLNATQEQFLRDLARAANLWPPLSRLLDAQRPESCALSLSEAYRFLKEAGPLLAEGGFGILAPPWWQKRAQLSTKVTITPDPAGGGLFGLRSLVQFNYVLAMGGQTLTAEQLDTMASLKVPLVQLRGQWVEVRSEDLNVALRALAERKRLGAMTLGEALKAASAGTIEGIEIAEFGATGWIGELLKGLSGNARMDAVRIPPGFHGELRHYQSTGVAWLGFLRRFGLGGCLADDMGLGKTVQTLVHLLCVRALEERPRPSLLVCPTSVITNWVRESERFTPSLRVTVHHGEDRERKPAEGWPSPADLVVTSYAVLWRDQEIFSKVEWDTVVLDEAQNVKNPASLAFRTARALRARHRIALTGTPVENRLTELWSIMEFLNGGFLGSLDGFRQDFARPIEWEGDGKRRETLRKLVRPFVLRRVKTDPKIAPDLPEKTEMKVVCTLSREQATLYEASVKDMMDKIAQADGMERRGLVLSALTRLKQICDHPALFLHDKSGLAGRSGKLDRLEEMLEEAMEERDKSLIFTQYSEMGELLRRRLVERFGRDIPFLHGAVSRKGRDEMVRAFQSEDGPPIFILSLKAGGFGLNLTAANRVFHFDRWWNPAVENQATDRAFRIGQKRNVMVHKFIVAGTLEEKIDALMERKRGLAEDVLGKGEAYLTELSTADLRDLFSLRASAVDDGVGSLTADPGRA